MENILDKKIDKWQDELWSMGYLDYKYSVTINTFIEDLKEIKREIEYEKSINDSNNCDTGNWNL